MEEVKGSAEMKVGGMEDGNGGQKGRERGNAAQERQLSVDPSEVRAVSQLNLRQFSLKLSTTLCAGNKLWA
jgi:hypothetical protein